ncbi:MAG TPA: hypothetical protein PKD90_00625 [Phnomibacter sp.]|nr:hypothetical protein [Phnomibacter sp.]
MVGAFVQMLALPLGSYDIAQLAYQIERHDLGFAGGHQDQYAASFGGINFMEFGPADRVVVNPLAVKPEVLFELENNLLLYYTGQYRQSGEIIMSQQQKVKDGVAPSIQAMHQLKQQAWQMKEALLKGRLQDMGELLETGFAFKKQMTEGISDPAIEQVYQAAMQAGATGGKISGAGGGGFMFFYCPGITRFRVATALQQYGGQIYPCHFTNQGMVSWAVR